MNLEADTKPIPPSGHIGVTPLHSFPDVDLKTERLWLDGKDTHTQVIQYKGKFVTSLSDSYIPLPNEYVLEALDGVVKEFGLVPLTQIPKAFSANNYKHIMQNPLGSQILAIYVKPDEVDVTGQGDKMFMGTVVKHSIDGRWALSMSTMSFRHICANLMLHIKRSSALSLFGGVQENPELTSNTNLTSLYKRHTSEIDLENLKLSFNQVFEDGQKVIQKYREMVKQRITKKIAQDVLSKLPKAVTKELPWAEFTPDGQLKFDEQTTQWKAFNDITEKLTHETTNFKSVLLNYQRVDTIFS